MKYIKLKLNYARNSLRYIIRTYNIKEIFIPYYLCDEIRHSIVKEDCKPKFYHIDNNFLPIREFKKEDYILYPNYFGICDKNVKILTQKYPLLIVDNAHSYYSEPKGFACFNSERKFHNVYNGSYLWIQKKGAPLEYEKHIQKELPKENREELIKNIEPLFVEEKQENFNNREFRQKSFKNLHKKYHSKNLLKIDLESANSPFCYPFLANSTSEADKLVKDLNENEITIYRYWKPLPKNYNEYKFYSRLVPIPLANYPRNLQ